MHTAQSAGRRAMAPRKTRSSIHFWYDNRCNKLAAAPSPFDHSNSYRSKTNHSLLTVSCTRNSSARPNNSFCCTHHCCLCTENLPSLDNCSAHNDCQRNCIPRPLNSRSWSHSSNSSYRRHAQLHRRWLNNGNYFSQHNFDPNRTRSKCCLAMRFVVWSADRAGRCLRAMRIRCSSMNMCCIECWWWAMEDIAAAERAQDSFDNCWMSPARSSSSSPFEVSATFCLAPLHASTWVRDFSACQVPNIYVFRDNSSPRAWDDRAFPSPGTARRALCVARNESQDSRNDLDNSTPQDARRSFDSDKVYRSVYVALYRK